MPINLKKGTNFQPRKSAEAVTHQYARGLDSSSFPLGGLTLALGWLTTLIIYCLCMASPLSFLFSFDEEGSFWKIFFLGPLAVISWFVFGWLWGHILGAIWKIITKLLVKL